MKAWIGTAVVLGLGLQSAAQDQDGLGTAPYRIAVTAKTRWNAHWNQNYHKFQQRLAERPFLKLASREPVPEDVAGYERWTFDVRGTWKVDPQEFRMLLGETIPINRYDITITGNVVRDRHLYLEHMVSGMKLRLMNRPKKPKEKVAPPDILSKIEEKLKQGEDYFDISGELVVAAAGRTILLESAQSLSEGEGKGESSGDQEKK